MAFIGPALGAIGTIASIGGTVLGAAGSIQSANAQAAQAEAQARERQRQANEQRALAQREAIERDREQTLLQSTLQARAAASGGSGATDPTVARLAGGIAKEGDYQRRGAIFEGESRASGLEAEAGIDRFRAGAIRRAGMLEGFGTLLGGAAEGFSRFRPRRSTTSYRGHYGTTGRGAFYGLT